MSLGLRLFARLPKSETRREKLLDNLGAWLIEKYAVMRPRIRRGDGKNAPSILCQMHPAAEEIEFSLNTANYLIMEANTTTVGPGYHVFVCDLLQDIEREFGMKWEESAHENYDFIDETGYFSNRNLDALNDEMLQWMRALAGMFFDGSIDPNGQTALCLPINVHYEVGAPAITPLGPRDLDWLRRASEDPRKGADFWAWYEPGLNAEFFRRRALALMWTDVRWRVPLNEKEKHILDEVADCLMRAHEIDPALEYPWAEWQEILSLSDRAGAEAALVSAHANGPASIGYRRGMVVTSLPGGWTVRIPGAFSEFSSDEEGDLYALDLPREIWFTAYQAHGRNAKEFKRSVGQMRKAGADYEDERDGYYSNALLSQKQNERGELRFILNTASVAVGARCVCTILFSNPADKEWALATWRSIRPPQKRV